jgi:hypothetical protein
LAPGIFLGAFFFSGRLVEFLNLLACRRRRPRYRDPAAITFRHSVGRSGAPSDIVRRQAWHRLDTLRLFLIRPSAYLFYSTAACLFDSQSCRRARVCSSIRQGLSAWRAGNRLPTAKLPTTVAAAARLSALHLQLADEQTNQNRFAVIGIEQRAGTVPKA